MRYPKNLDDIFKVFDNFPQEPFKFDQDAYTTTSTIIVNEDIKTMLTRLEEKIDRVLDILDPQEQEHAEVEEINTPEVTYAAISYMKDSLLNFGVVRFAHDRENIDQAVAECFEVTDYTVIQAQHDPIPGFAVLRETQLAAYIN